MSPSDDAIIDPQIIEVWCLFVIIIGLLKRIQTSQLQAELSLKHIKSLKTTLLSARLVHVHGWEVISSVFLMSSPFPT